MSMPKSDIGIARNIKTIEWLKAELVSGVAVFFRGLVKNTEETIIDGLANIVITCFILGNRLGISFSRLDIKIENKIKANIEQDHEIEQWYGDFSALLRYLQDNKR